MNGRSAPVDTVIPEPNPDDVEEALKRLVQLLGYRRVVQLPKLLDDVALDTRFGDVKIIITDGRVRLLKAEKSYE
jgi:hypothetical protein